MRQLSPAIKTPTPCAAVRGFQDSFFRERYDGCVEPKGNTSEPGPRGRGQLTLAGSLCLTLAACGGKAVHSSPGEESPATGGTLVDIDGDGVPDVIGPESGGAGGAGGTPSFTGGAAALTEEEYVQWLETGWDAKPRLPADQREESDVWQPTELPIGSPGWKDSEDAFCQPFQGARMVGLSADERGVFAAVNRHCGNTLEFEHCDRVEGGALFLNNGESWELVASPDIPIEEMHPLADGSFLFGVEVLFHPDRGAQVLQGPSGVPFYEQPYELATRGRSAFAARLSTDPFSTEDHGPLLIALEAGNSVWNVENTFERSGWVSIDSERRLVIFRHDEVFFKTSQGWEPVAHLPAGQYGGRGGWFESPDNFWVVGEQGIVHCEAEDCHVDSADVGSSQYQFQFQLLGDRLFFISESTVGYLEDHEATLLAGVSAGLQFSHLAAGPEHIFVSAFVRTLDEYQCGGHVLFWLDGDEFHRF